MVLNSILEKPKNVKFESQEPHEKVYFILRRHPITNLGWILLSVFLLCIPLIINIMLLSDTELQLIEIDPKYEFILTIIWYSVTMLYTFESFLIWYFSAYIITDERVIDIDFNGLWGKRVSEASLGNVEDVTYETNQFLQILFDYGNIFMQTAAEKREFEFNAVPKPGKVHDKLTDLVEAYKQKHR